MSTLTGYWILEATGFALLHSLWKGAALALMYMLLSAYRVKKPEVRYRLAAGLSFTAVVLFFIDFFSYKASTQFLAFTILEEWTNRIDRSTVFSLAAVPYFLLLLIPVLRFVFNWQWVTTIRRKGLSKAPLHARLFVQQSGFQLHLGKPVQVMLSGLVPSPLTVGYLKPIILLPFSCITTLSPQQLEAVLLHELAHIKRSDYLFNILLQVTDALMYFNPFTVYLVRQAAAERELACDAVVVRTGYEPQQYAAALLCLQQTAQPRALALAAAKRGQLVQRVQVMLGVPQHAKPNKSFIALALFSCLFLAHLMLLKGAGTIAVEQPIGLLAGFPVVGDDVAKPVQNESGFLNASVAAPVGLTKKSAQQQERNNLPKAIAKRRVAIPVKRFTVPIVVEAVAAADAQYVCETELTDEQTKDVDDLLKQTKKSLSAQWPQALEGFGDGLTKAEVDLARTEYLKEVDSLNWDFLRNQLMNQYHQLDWNKIKACADEEGGEEQPFTLLDALQQLAERPATENFPDRSVKSAEALQQQLMDAVKSLQGLKKNRIKL